jgi:hypothetical protein
MRQIDKLTLMMLDRSVSKDNNSDSPVCLPTIPFSSARKDRAPACGGQEW